MTDKITGVVVDIPTIIEEAKREKSTEHRDRRLLALIALVSERAFRRGVQHGFEIGSGSWGDAPTSEEIALWRFSGITESKPPPGSKLPRPDNLTARLEMEEPTLLFRIHEILDADKKGLVATPIDEFLAMDFTDEEEKKQ